MATAVIEDGGGSGGGCEDGVGGGRRCEDGGGRGSGCENGQRRSLAMAMRMVEVVAVT